MEVSTTPRPVNRRGAPLSPDDVAQIIRLTREGVAYEEIACALGRTAVAIKTKVSDLRSMGIHIPQRPRGGAKSWTYGSKSAAPADKMTRAQCEALAARLQAYWHARGAKHVSVWVDALTLETKSNLVGGNPPAPSIGVAAE
jgi:hypothetical protein